jgi:hypothetical protein
VVFYNSYLPLMVDDAEEVRDAAAAAATGVKGEDDVRAAQEKVSSEYSSKGQMWGYIGGTACLVLSFILITGMTLGGVSTWWSLGIGRVGTFHVILLDVSITCYFAVKTHAINDSQYDSHVTNLTPGSAAP